MSQVFGLTLENTGSCMAEQDKYATPLPLYVAFFPYIVHSRPTALHPCASWFCLSAISVPCQLQQIFMLPRCTLYVFFFFFFWAWQGYRENSVPLWLSIKGSGTLQSPQSCCLITYEQAEAGVSFWHKAWLHSCELAAGEWAGRWPEEPRVSGNLSGVRLHDKRDCNLYSF